MVNKLDTIDNEFRNFKMEVLAGDNDFVVQTVRHSFCRLIHLLLNCQTYTVSSNFPVRIELHVPL